MYIAIMYIHHIIIIWCQRILMKLVFQLRSTSVYYTLHRRMTIKIENHSVHLSAYWYQHYAIIFEWQNNIIIDRYGTATCAFI